MKKLTNRRLVMSKDLNGANKLFGGTILAWIDEQAYIDVRTILKTRNIVTKYISQVHFNSGANIGDIIEITTEFVNFGKSSITLFISVDNLSTQKNVSTIEEIVMVNVDENNNPIAHNFSEENIQELTITI